MNGPLLPGRARWFFLLAPPVLACLFDPACEHAAGPVARAWLTLTVFTVAVGLAVHHGFEALAARTVGLGPWLRAPALLASVTAIVVAVSVPLLPFVVWLYPEAAGDELAIVGRAVLVSYAYVGLATLVGRLLDDARRQREHADTQRLAALRAQLEPHFLFNSLNVCAGLVHESPDVAERTLDRLTEFLRHALHSQDRARVPIDEELEAVRCYLEVQRQRFGDKLRYSVSCDARGSVPPMLLQPLVENAVVHGVRDGGTIEVAARSERGRIVLSVRDDGVGPGGSSRSGTGLGQRSVRERLRLLYGERARLELGGSGPGYLCRVEVPR